MHQSYWVRAALVALADAKNFLGHNPKKTVAAYLTTFIGFGIYGSWTSTQDLMGKVQWWLAGILAGLVLFLLTFLWHLLAAPPKMEQEAAAKAEDRAKQATAERGQLLEQAAREQDRHAQEIAGLGQRHQEEVAQLQAQLFTQEQGRQRRQRLNRLMEQGQQIIRECLYESQGIVQVPREAPAPTPEDEQRVAAWIAAARDLVAQDHPEFSAQLMNDGGLLPSDTVPGDKHSRFTDLKTQVERRLVRLGELLR